MEIGQNIIDQDDKVKERMAQLQQLNDQMLQQRKELQNTYHNVKLLSEIGQQITSTLSLEKIIGTVYDNVNNLMDAAIFGIGIYNAAERRLEFRGTIEKGDKIPDFYSSEDNENSSAIWCFKNQKELIINDIQVEYDKYIKNSPPPVAEDTPESLMYLPLMTHEGAIGVITVQSFKKFSYNSFHIDILHTLASYVIIAIQNADSYRKMIDAFEQLKATQSKLVESEKMASLGVLTAGVAHEINNPINFISAGIEALKENFTDVTDLLELYFQYDPATSPPGEWEKILQKKKRLTGDGILPEIKDLLASIKNGAARTTEIVKGLRSFSRLDENDRKKANLEEGIDNTLVILNSRMKNRVEVIKEYGKIPEILCFPGQLNQVFMNVLHNASDAIEGEGKITIKTWQENGHVKITMRDTGNGMPEEVRRKIFEPFFTTKAVGKGTGLGLSIAYGIIEKHKGVIEVESAIGKGTQFTITLPVA